MNTKTAHQCTIATSTESEVTRQHIGYLFQSVKTHYPQSITVAAEENDLKIEPSTCHINIPDNF